MYTAAITDEARIEHNLCCQIVMPLETECDAMHEMHDIDMLSFTLRAPHVIATVHVHSPDIKLILVYTCILIDDTRLHWWSQSALLILMGDYFEMKCAMSGLNHQTLEMS